MDDFLALAKSLNYRSSVVCLYSICASEVCSIHLPGIWPWIIADTELYHLFNRTTKLNMFCNLVKSGVCSLWYSSRSFFATK